MGIALELFSKRVPLIRVLIIRYVVSYLLSYHNYFVYTKYEVHVVRSRRAREQQVRSTYFASHSPTKGSRYLM